MLARNYEDTSACIHRPGHAAAAAATHACVLADTLCWTIDIQMLLSLVNAYLILNIWINSLKSEDHPSEYNSCWKGIALAYDLIPLGSSNLQSAKCNYTILTRLYIINYHFLLLLYNFFKKHTKNIFELLLFYFLYFVVSGIFGMRFNVHVHAIPYNL